MTNRKLIASKSERRITVDGYVAMKLLTGTIMRYRIPYFGCWIESDIELDPQSVLSAKKKDTKHWRVLVACLYRTASNGNLM